MNYWLAKSEPFKYSWDDFLKDGSTYWDGVRNYQARNNLKAMKVKDKVFFYHSNEGLRVVGVAEVIKEHYQDPTTYDRRCVVVDLKPVDTLKNPITLTQIKEEPSLKEISLVKQGRLSVMPLSKKEFDKILAMSESKYK